MPRSFAAALIALAALALPARHAAAQTVKQDVKTGAHAVGTEASKIGKGTAKVAVKAADATANEGKKVGTYVKHRVSKPHHRTVHHAVKPDSSR